MTQYGNEQKMKICPSCGAVYYVAGVTPCPYCGKKVLPAKSYHLQAAISFLLGALGLVSIFFAPFGVVLAGMGLFLGGFVIKKTEQFRPLAWLGTTFAILAILTFLFSLGTNVYFIIQMML